MTTHVVNTHEAKSRLSELIREAEAGAEVMVARNGQPVAKIVAWTGSERGRKPGSWSGRVTYGDNLVDSDPELVALFDEADDTAAP